MVIGWILLSRFAGARIARASRGSYLLPISRENGPYHLPLRHCRDWKLPLWPLNLVRFYIGPWLLVTKFSLFLSLRAHPLRITL